MKVLPPDLASDVSAARFQREVTLTAQLQHPHILPILAAGAKDGLLYYITPWVAGESLRQRLNREHRLPVGDAVRILTEVADALAKAHTGGFVHRDVKPENILLQDGHALLADFGVARALAQATNNPRLTATGMVPGTPAYMAPEQLAGEDHVDARADIYALAVVGFEMLAGESPFSGTTPQAVAAAHFTGSPPSISNVRPDVPRPIASVIARALAREPGDRFATAAEFRDALARGPRLPAGRRWWPAAAILAGTAVLVLFGWLWNRRRAVALPPDRNLIAIEPFVVLEPSLGVWREGMVDVLARNLDGAGPLRVVAPAVVIRRASTGNATPLDLARAFGAGLAVTGQLEQSGRDSVRLSATVADATDGRALDEIMVRGSNEHMDWLTDSITVGVLRSIARRQSVGVARGSLAGARSLPALRALLEAEQAFRRGAWDSAQQAAEHAIEIDSNFALAYYWASFARGWSHTAGDSLSVVYGERAQALNHGLSPRDSFLIASNKMMDDPDHCDVPALLAAGSASVVRYPDDPQIWNNLGEIREHCGVGMRTGVSARATLDPFARAIALDSSFAPAYVHSVQLALEAEGIDAGLRYARRYLALNAADANEPLARLVIARLGRPPDSIAARRVADSATPQGLGMAAVALSVVPDSGGTERWLGQTLARRIGLMTPVWPAPQNQGPPSAAFILDGLFRRGHLHQAWSNISGFAGGRSLSAVLNGPATILLSLAELNVMPTAIVDSVLRTDYNMKHGWSRIGLRWWAERGDTVDLVRFLAVRGARVGHADSMDLQPAAYDAAAIRGYLALARHDTADALRRFGSLPDTLCGGRCLLDAITFAELLAGHGRAAAADSLLDRRYTIMVGSGGMYVLQQLALARAAARSGDDRTARDAYERVADFWAAGDPELQPFVTEARTELARLSHPR